MYLSRATHSRAVPMERKKVGEVFHFYGKIGVCAIRLTDGALAVGDTVAIQGPTSNLEQRVDSLQVEHAEVTRGEIGQEVGMKVRERVREKDFVYKLVETAVAIKAAPPKKPTRAEKNRRNSVIGKRNAVMTPPSENSPHSNGSRNTSCSRASPSA